MSDAGSLYFDDEHPDGFETPSAAAEWARGQTLWSYGSELDFSDGVTSVIVLGSEVNAANEAWQAWADAGRRRPYPEIEVRNFAAEQALLPTHETGPDRVQSNWGCRARRAWTIASGSSSARSRVSTRSETSRFWVE